MLVATPLVMPPVPAPSYQRASWSLLLLSLLPPAIAVGQEARYEVGQRMRAFERAFAPRLHDQIARARVLPHLQAAVQSFFAMNPGQTAASLDRARFALRAAEPGASVRTSRITVCFSHTEYRTSSTR
jgi:hypothetical protein